MNGSWGWILVAYLASAPVVAGCGLCGAEKVVEKTRSEKIRAGNEVSDGERDKLKERKLLDDGEAVIWLYDNTVTGIGTNLNVLTTKRVANVRGDNVFSATFDDIKDASYEAGGTSERIRVEKTSGEFVVLQFGINSDSRRMYDSLCGKIPDKCSTK